MTDKHSLAVDRQMANHPLHQAVFNFNIAEPICRARIRVGARSGH